MRFGKPRKNQKRINPRYHLNETAKIENNSSKNMHDVQFYLEEFYPFAKEALGFDQDASIVFESDFSNAKNPLGKTAHYDPSNSTVTVYVDKRHPKDVMRSVSHELVHHAQNVRGDLQGGSMEEGYAQTDDHLREMEKEAYTKGNMLFRDWTDSRSNPDGQKGIMARIMQEWGYDESALTEEGGGFEEGQLVKVVASALAIDGEKNGTVVSYEDPAVLIKLDDDQEGKYVPDDKMVKVKKDYVEPRAEAGFDDVMGEEEKVTEMYDDDFGDEDLDMAALEKEFPWLAKDVKTREAPPEVAADLADEFGDKGEPEEEEEPVVMKDSLGEGDKRWADYGTGDAETGRPPSPPSERTNPTGWNEYMEAYMMATADAKAKQGTWHDDEHETLADRKFADSMREKLSPEEKEWHKSVMDKGKVPNLKGDMGEIPGMEGPFQFKSGAVLYYDRKAGKYYDRGSDMYIDDEEASQLTMEGHWDKGDDDVLAPGEDPGDKDYEKTTGKKKAKKQENKEMNIEEIVRSAVRRALKEKKYRREDEKDEVEEGKYRREDEEEEKTEETVTEGATDEEFDKLDAIVAALGPDEALQALVQALPSHVTHEMLDYIGQMHEIPLDGGMGDMEEKLSAGQEELDLDDDGKIEPSDLAGLRSGKTDDEVGEETEEGVKEGDRPFGTEAGHLQVGDEVTANGQPGTVTEVHSDGMVDVQLARGTVSMDPGDVVKHGGAEDAPLNDYFKEDVATPTVMRGPFDPSQIQSVEDPEYGGMIHTLPNVELTGDVEQDTYDMAGGDEEMESWLWGEMESGDSITDPAGKHVYSGSDVQDFLRAIEDDANNPASSVHYENKSDKEWYDSKLFENLKRKWAK